MPQEFLDKEERTPVFTTEGVTVQWANLLDAEFAEVWPVQGPRSSTVTSASQMNIVKREHIRLPLRNSPVTLGPVLEGLASQSVDVA